MKKIVVELFLQLAKHYGGRNYLHVAVINKSVLMTDALLNLGRSCGKTYELCHEKMTGKMIFLSPTPRKGFAIVRSIISAFLSYKLVTCQA